MLGQKPGDEDGQERNRDCCDVAAAGDPDMIQIDNVVEEDPWHNNDDGNVAER